MSRFYWILGAVAVIGVGVVGYSVGSSALGTAATEPIDLEGLDDMSRLASLAQGVTKGEESAPITIIEFGDYQCPGCGQFALSVKPQIELTYVQTGKAKFVYYDLPLVSIHPHAFLAARTARCAGDQGLFWEYHDVVFRNQASWSSRTDPTADFLDYGDVVGLDADQFEACVKSDAHADVVTANMRLAEELGLSGTPSVMVNRQGGMARRMGNNFDFQSIRNVVDDMLEEPADTSGN